MSILCLLCISRSSMWWVSAAVKSIFAALRAYVFFFFFLSLYFFQEASFLQALALLIHLVYNPLSCCRSSHSVCSPRGRIVWERRPGGPGSCLMDGGIVGPSDRGITAAALHRRDLSPSRRPVDYVSNCSVPLMWLALVLRWSTEAAVKPGLVTDVGL